MASTGLLAKLRSPAVLATQNGTSSLALPNYMADEVEQSRASIAAVMCNQAPFVHAARTSHASATQALSADDEEDDYSTPVESEWPRGSRTGPSAPASAPRRATPPQHPPATDSLCGTDARRGSSRGGTSGAVSPRTCEQQPQPQHHSAPPRSPAPFRPLTSASDSAARASASSGGAATTGAGGPRRPLSASPTTQAHLPAGQAGAGGAADSDLLSAVTGRLAQQLGLDEDELDEEELAADLQVAHDTLERALQMARGGGVAGDAGLARSGSRGSDGSSTAVSAFGGCSSRGGGGGGAAGRSVRSSGGGAESSVSSSRHSCGAAPGGGRAGGGSAGGSRRSSATEARPMRVVEVEITPGPGPGPTTSCPQTEAPRRGPSEAGGGGGGGAGLYRHQPSSSAGGILDRIHRTSSTGGVAAPGPFASACANPASYELWSLHSSSPANSRAASILSAASSVTAAAGANATPALCGRGSAPVTPSRHSPRASGAAFGSVSSPDNPVTVAEEVDLEAASPGGTAPGRLVNGSSCGAGKFGGPAEPGPAPPGEREAGSGTSLKLGGLLKLAKKAFRRTTASGGGSGGSLNDAPPPAPPSAFAQAAAAVQVRPSVPGSMSTPPSPTQLLVRVPERRASASTAQLKEQRQAPAPVTGMLFDRNSHNRAAAAAGTAAPAQQCAAVLLPAASVASSLSDIALDSPTTEPSTPRGGVAAGGAASGGASAMRSPFSTQANTVSGAAGSGSAASQAAPIGGWASAPSQRRRHSALAGGHGGAATDLQVTAHVQSYLHNQQQYLQQLQVQAASSDSDGGGADQGPLSGGSPPRQEGAPGGAAPPSAGSSGGGGGGSWADRSVRAGRVSGPGGGAAAPGAQPRRSTDTNPSLGPARPGLGWQPCSVRPAHAPPVVPASPPSILATANISPRNSLASGAPMAVPPATDGAAGATSRQTASSPVATRVSVSGSSGAPRPQQAASSAGSAAAPAPAPSAAADAPGPRLPRSSGGGGTGSAGPAVTVSPRPPPIQLPPGPAVSPRPAAPTRDARRVSAADGTQG